MTLIFRLTMALALFSTMACAKYAGPEIASIVDDTQSELNPEQPVPVPDKPAEPHPDSGKDIPLAICSNLDFTNVTWPADFTIEDRNAMALALNISGSFEGNHGWTNLTNNFDGQGVSMGLLQQNFGQGSIQPLFIRMLEDHREVMEDAMTPVMLSSMEKMLKVWAKATSLIPSEPLEAFAESQSEERELLSLNDLSSLGDVEKFYAHPEFALAPHNNRSVEWAKNTVFKTRRGKKFKPAWKKAFKKIAGDPTYISLQIQAARHLHDRAWGYQKRLGYTELRGYLFLFDISVQNGTLKEKHFKKFFKWRSKNPNAGEQEQMLEMLEIRVVDSNPRWQDDVRRRKRTTIRGVGKVHGKNRDLQSEYCYNQTELYPL